MNCAKCGVAAKSLKDRLPMGWKRKGDAVYCATCWRGLFILRAVTVPIVGPTDPAQWPAFREAITQGWRDCTELSNWTLTELYARDVRRSGGDKKMPPMPKIYLYPEARRRFPNLSTRALISVLWAVQKKYKATRYKTIWTLEQSLSNYRYPTPYVAHNAGYKITFEEQRPVLSLALGGQRWALRLRGGPEFRRQLTALRHVAAGEAVQGELAIYRVRAQASSHRNGVSDHAENGTSTQWRLMAKVVAWLPRQTTETERQGTLIVKTASDALLVAVDAKGERIWREHADHLRRWSAEHARRLQNWSDDTKAEQRPVSSFSARREAAVKKQHDRVNSALHEITRHLARFVERRHYTEVSYDDSDKSFVGNFPWFRLKEMLAMKLDESGITLTASGDVVNEKP